MLDPEIRKKVAHPHVAVSPKVCGGSPVIAGTRFPVRSVIAYVLHHGLTPEELVARFNELTLAQVHDALAYYYDNRKEIDKDISQNTEASARKKLSRSAPTRTSPLRKENGFWVYRTGRPLKGLSMTAAIRRSRAR